MDKKQSAVEWLVEELEQHHTKIDIKNTVVFQQAKAIEKKQIIDAWKNAEGYNDLTNEELAEKYYTSTYGK